jgi:AP-1 complex subunit gamma-1
MTVRLRDLIKSVRTCKTAAEERSTIAKECAAIRTDFKNENSEYRQRNVAKLLYIHMLGYPTHFGQMECFKLIVSPSYSDKRIGYLGLMTILDERQEVLMLVTNSLRQDMYHQNQFVVGLALCALANLATSGIAHDLSSDVGKLLAHQIPYIRKKVRERKRTEQRSYHHIFCHSFHFSFISDTDFVLLLLFRLLFALSD